MIGDGYIAIAFEAARAADPDALLLYDDFYDDLSVTQDAVESGLAIVPGANGRTHRTAACRAQVRRRAVVDRRARRGRRPDRRDRIPGPSPLPRPCRLRDVQRAGSPTSVSSGRSPSSTCRSPSPRSPTPTPSPSRRTRTPARCRHASTPTRATPSSRGASPTVSRRHPTTTGGAFGGALWFDALDAAEAGRRSDGRRSRGHRARAGDHRGRPDRAHEPTDRRPALLRRSRRTTRTRSWHSPSLQERSRWSERSSCSHDDRPRARRTPEQEESCSGVGGDDENRTHVHGFAGRCLNHSATSPVEVSRIAAPGSARRVAGHGAGRSDAYHAASRASPSSIDTSGVQPRSSRAGRGSNQCAVPSCSARNCVSGGSSVGATAARPARRTPATRPTRNGHVTRSERHPGRRADPLDQLADHPRLAVGHHVGPPEHPRPVRPRRALRPARSTALSM